MKRILAVLPPLFLLAACTPEGYPSSDGEMWAVAAIMLGLFALAGWCVWLWLRADR